jgi:hypothetical protein
MEAIFQSSRMTYFCEEVIEKTPFTEKKNL